MMRNRKGFTLIELLIVVVIIGILAAIAIPKFAATKDKAKLAAVKSDLTSIRTAQEAYFSDYMTYTGALSTAMFSPTKGNTVSITGAGATGYTAEVTGTGITSDPKKCTVTVGSGASDGEIICS